MKKKYYILLSLFFLLSFSGHSQEPSVKSPGAFREFYTVEISGLKSRDQAKLLDDQVLRDQRFFSCKTNVGTKTIRITAQKGIMIEDIKRYTSQFDLVIKNYTEQYSIKKPAGW